MKTPQVPAPWSPHGRDLAPRANYEPSSSPKAEATPAELVRSYEAQTIGSRQWHRHPFGLIYTDGILYLAETCEAFWLIDVVASWQREVMKKLEAHRLRPFQVWRLRLVDGDNVELGWILDAWSDTPEYKGGEDGRPSVRLAYQEIGYSSFPEALSPFEFWVEGDTALLKAEH